MTQINDTWEKVGDLVRDHNGNVVEVIRSHAPGKCTNCFYDTPDDPCVLLMAGKHISGTPYIECTAADVIFRLDRIGLPPQTITI